MLHPSRRQRSNGVWIIRRTAAATPVQRRDREKKDAKRTQISPLALSKTPFQAKNEPKRTHVSDHSRASATRPRGAGAVGRNPDGRRPRGATVGSPASACGLRLRRSNPGLRFRYSQFDTRHSASRLPSSAFGPASAGTPFQPLSRGRGSGRTRYTRRASASRDAREGSAPPTSRRCFS